MMHNLEKRTESGFTLVESMVSMVVLALTALALFPVFNQISQIYKFSDSRELCQAIVREKLNEYLFGQPVNMATELIGGVAANQVISLDTMSGTAYGASGYTGAVASGGFMYSKMRYNQYFDQGVCGGADARSVASIFTTNAPYLGMRECVGSNTAFQDVAGFDPTQCVSARDSRIINELPGFKLYVRLQRRTPWTYGIAPQDSTAGGRFSTNCPTSSGTTTTYDFDELSDAIEVTVTGVIDIASVNATNPLVRFAGIGDSNRLQCSQSGVVRKPHHVVRYYLSRTGRVYPASGRSRNASYTLDGTNEVDVEDTTTLVFHDLFSQSTSMRATGITSFAVHPRNWSIWVLRPGSLIRYSNCSGIPINCSLIPNGTAGVREDGSGTGPSVQEFAVLPSIHSIGIDFRTGAVYGMTNDRSQILQISLDGAEPTHGLAAPFLADALAQCSDCASGTPGVVTYQSISPGTFPFPTATAQRLTGYFLDPGGSEAFVSDFTTAMAAGGVGYSTAIYRSSDSTLTSPLAILPVGASNFSR